MNQTSTGIVGILICCAVAQTMVGHVGHSPWLVYIFKPLATMLVLGIGLANWISQKQNYALWICLGLVFSLAGDILLLWPERFFVTGLGAFLLAHMAYLAAFTRGMKFPASWGIWGLYLAIGAGVFAVFGGGVVSDLKPAVGLYGFAVVTMAAQAMGRYLRLRTCAALLAATGGILFMLSDGLLAVDRFRAAIPYALIVVLAPYYVGQVLIALSTGRGQQTKAIAVGTIRTDQGDGG